MQTGTTTYGKQYGRSKIYIYILAYHSHMIQPFYFWTCNIQAAITTRKLVPLPQNLRLPACGRVVDSGLPHPPALYTHAPSQWRNLLTVSACVSLRQLISECWTRAHSRALEGGHLPATGRAYMSQAGPWNDTQSCDAR